MDIQWNPRIMDTLGKHFVHCSEVVPSSEVEKCMGNKNIGAGGKQCVHSREVVHSSECHYQRFHCHME